MERKLEYGARGAVGVVVGTANASTEPELRVLLGADICQFATRYAMRELDAAEDAGDPFDEIDRALARLAAVPIDVAAVAATSLAYPAGEQAFAQLLHGLEGFRGFAVISAAQACAHALDMLHARRIGVVTGASRHTAEAATRFFEERGFRVTDGAVAANDPDLAGVSASTATVLAAVRSIDTQNVDAILLADCELPTLGALDALLGPGQVPVLSANLCLGWGSAQRLLGEPADERSLQRWLDDQAPWRMQLGYAYPSAVAPRPSIF